jgi:hypothetical protein
MSCARITQTPIVVDIPEACVDSVDDSESDKRRFVWAALIDAIDAQRHVVHDSCEVLATVKKMREFVACVPVSTDTLQSTPDAG